MDAGLTLLYNHTTTAMMAAITLDGAGVVYEPDALARCMKRAEDLLAATWHRGDFWGSEVAVRGLFRDAYASGLAALPALAGRSEDARALADLMYSGFADSRHWSLYPDVLPALDRLRGAGVVMGVVSDWGHGLEALLLELGLGPYLDCLVVSSRLGISKPSAEVFAMALERLEASAMGSWYVGDTYVKDVVGARAAGIRPVLLDRAGKLEAEAVAADCAVVRDLVALADLVLASSS